MKTIAVPLLLASSARAETKRPGMMQDYGYPVPVLIADTYTDGDCTDATVTAEKTKLATLNSALTALISDLTPFSETETAAVTAKTDAVNAVIAKDTAIAGDLATDDTAQQSELTLKKALDDATLAKAAAVTAAAAADTAKQAADSAKSTGDDLLSAMTTAATAANDHKTAEDTQLSTLSGEVTSSANDLAAKTSIGNTASVLNGAADGGLKKLWEDLAVTSTANLATTAAAEVIVTDQTALITKLTAQVTLATGDKNAGDAGSSAGLAAAQDQALATALTFLTKAGGTQEIWVNHAKATVTAMIAWNVEEVSQGWTAVGTNQLCDSTLTAGTAGTLAVCKAECAALKAWTMNGNLPSTASKTAGAGYCYGILHKTDNSYCKLYTAVSTVAAVGSSGDSVGDGCFSRAKSGLATALVDANALSADGGVSHVNMVAGIATWALEVGKQDVTAQNLLIANQYFTKITASKASADSAKTGFDTTYTNAKAISDPAAASTATAKNLWVTQEAAIATAQALSDSKIALKAAQELEVTAQIAIKTLADDDVTAQTGVASGLATKATEALTAKTNADQAVTDKDGLLTTATTNYNSQVTVAANAATGVATVLSELATLRTASTTAGTALTTAITAVTNQNALISDKKGEVAAATTLHLAALVKCKEDQYDKYATALATAETKRKTDLAAIAKLIDDAKDAAPTRGAAGARCEKAMSNGTFRPRRDEATCAEGLCCGAAKIDIGKAVMTIETCETVGTTEIDYVEPRKPMAITAPAAVKKPWTCIQGAQKLAAAASALAAAVYMLA